MTLAVLGTLSTNKQSNKQKETKQPTLNFSMMSYGITSTVMGSGSILLNRKPKKQVPGIRKKETRHCRTRRHQIDQMIPARNSHITGALNLITYVYMCISST